MEMDNTRRALLALAAVGILIAAFALLSGSGDDDPASAPVATGPTGGATAPSSGAATATARTTETTTAATTPTTPAPVQIEVQDGAVKGGIAEIDVRKGERVRIAVKSDVTDHVHVHGYDLMKDVSPGRRASFSFTATVEGRFEVELEERAMQIARIEVSP